MMLRYIMRDNEKVLQYGQVETIWDWETDSNGSVVLSPVVKSEKLIWHDVPLEQGTDDE